jgi:hypothetical protein
MKQKGVIFLFGGLGILTLIVLVALFFFYPKESSATHQPLAMAPQNPAATGTSATPVPNSFDPVEWTRSSQPGTPAPAGVPGSVPPATSNTAPSADGFVVTMNPPSTSVPSAPVATPAPAVAFPAPSTTPAPPPAATPAPRRASEKVVQERSKPRPAPSKYVRVHQYWIQVGAYKDRFEAEQAVKTLKAQGLRGNLFTVQSAGHTWVRVRVGPYADKSEAQKFLAWVKPVKGMEQSFITVVSVEKRI